MHTEYSLLDGACRIPKLVARAKELGQTALAVTDHGVMYGAVAFYKACCDAGIKPVIGCEVYVAPRSLTDKDHGVDGEYTHLILLCKNETGYRNLCYMVSMGYSRKALLNVCEAVIDDINQENSKNISGQMDLFGAAADEPAAAPMPLRLPDIGEFTPQEKMAMEKEATGLYLSGHPMDDYRDAVRKIGAVPIGAIKADFAQEGGPTRFEDNQTVTVAGVAASSRTRTTKSNALMAYIQLEDDTGSMELIAFARALDTGGAYVKDGAPLIIKGRISVRDEKEPQIMVDSIRPLSDADEPGTSAPPPRQPKLWVKLPSESDPSMARIKLILEMFPGTGQMIIYCSDSKKRIGASCVIHDALVAELKEMLGEENVVVK